VNLIVHALISVSVAGAGVGFGYLFSRLPKPFWTLGYFIPFALICIYGASIHLPGFTPPASVAWMMTGLRKFAFFGFVATMVLTTPLSRVPRKKDRLVVAGFMVVMVSTTSVWPFIAPAFSRNQLAHLKTQIDPNGVCLQTTDYTCGPAAAVTALRKLGLSGEEGRIAILSCTTPTTGTSPDILAQVLSDEYRKDGLEAEFRTFKKLSDLKQAGLTLAVVKYSFLVDHYVTVLEVTDSDVVVADPLKGLYSIPYDDFLKKWRFNGIVLKRK
jgi:predicted double-glycine peptidase